MFASATGYSYFIVLLIFILSLFSCQEKEALSFVPTQLVSVDEKVLTVGTSYSPTSIRYPTIAELGKSPIVYPSETSARGITLKTFSGQKHYLSYYQAKSLKQQEENSKIFNWKNDKVGEIFSYGNRTRIIDFLPLENGTFICLNYERSNACTSVKYYSNNKLLRETNFEIGIETTIPKQLLQLPNDELLILGVADGFEFKDGHSYKEEFAKGFLIQTDNNGIELNRWTKSSADGHVFFNQMVTSNKSIYIVGEIQKPETGMDIFISKLNSNLELVAEYILEKPKHQEVLNIYNNNGSPELMIKDKNDTGQHHVTLLQFNQGLKLIDSTESQAVEHTDFIDAIKQKDSYYVLTHQKENRVDIPNSIILKMNLKGKIIEEVVVRSD